MWFDARAKLAEIEGRAPATSATLATNKAAPAPRVAGVAIVAATPDPELIRDFLEERAAIREHLGGQTRAEAEAGALGDVARSTGVVTARLSRLWIIDGGRR